MINEKCRFRMAFSTWSREQAGWVTPVGCNLDTDLRNLEYP